VRGGCVVGGGGGWVVGGGGGSVGGGVVGGGGSVGGGVVGVVGGSWPRAGRATPSTPNTITRTITARARRRAAPTRLQPDDPQV
jgi:hypothetical protein